MYQYPVKVSRLLNQDPWMVPLKKVICALRKLKTTPSRAYYSTECPRVFEGGYQNSKATFRRSGVALSAINAHLRPDWSYLLPMMDRQSFGMLGDKDVSTV
jgi:hypothetical protein